MRLALALSCFLLPVTAKAVSKRPWWFEGIVRSHCTSPNVRCTNYKDGNTIANFTYVGDGHKQVFMLNWSLWEKHNGDMYALSNRNATRKDILERQKERLQLGQSACAGSAAACGIVITAIPLFIPKIILSFSCTAGATFCKLRTDEEIAKIDTELKEIETATASGETHTTGGGSNPPAPAQPLPQLPPPPNGTVTIIDHLP